MSIFWSGGNTRKHESYARKRDKFTGPDDNSPGIVLVLALMAGGIGASLLMLLGGWVIARLVG